jgi:hypothetical protein
MGDVRQDNFIPAAEDPNSPYFDAAYAQQKAEIDALRANSGTEEKGRGLFGNIKDFVQDKVIDPIQERRENNENEAQQMAENTALKDTWMPEEYNPITAPTRQDVQAAEIGGSPIATRSDIMRDKAVDTALRTGSTQEEADAMGQEVIDNAFAQAQQNNLENMSMVDGMTLAATLDKKEMETGVRPSLETPEEREAMSREVLGWDDKDAQPEVDAISSAQPYDGPKEVETPPEEDVLVSPATQEEEAVAAEEEAAAGAEIPVPPKVEEEVITTLEDAKTEEDFLSRAKGLMEDYGVPILGLIQSFLYGYAGNDSETILQRKNRISDEEASRAWEEDMISKGRTYEEEQAAIEREWAASQQAQQQQFQKELAEMAGTQDLEAIRATADARAEASGNAPMSDAEFLASLQSAAGQFNME